MQTKNNGYRSSNLCPSFSILGRQASFASQAAGTVLTRIIHQTGYSGLASVA
jgi:hypothetical protein